MSGFIPLDWPERVPEKNIEADPLNKVSSDPLKVPMDFLAICDMNISSLKNLIKIHRQAIEDVLEEKGMLENKQSNENGILYRIEISIPLRIKVYEKRMKELESWIYQIKHYRQVEAHERAVKKAQREGKPLPKAPYKKKIKAEDVKHVPVDRFVTIPRGGMMNCFWHTEDTPSLKYYKKDNSFHCFGQCNKHYDVIDLVMLKYNLPFKEALTYLSQYI